MEGDLKVWIHKCSYLCFFYLFCT